MTLERVLRIPEVEVWLGELDVPSAEVGRLAAVLSEPELRQSRTFGADILRDRFVVRRASLRTLLGCELGVDPRVVPLNRSSTGKPCIDGGAFCFNVSASQGFALFAVSRVAEVGVDVEVLRPFPEEPTASTHFTERERAPGGPPFFALWTRKEACAKAVGVGLLDSFACFETPWPVDEEFHALPWPGGRIAARDLWRMPGLQGAVALWRPACETVEPLRSSI